MKNLVLKRFAVTCLVVASACCLYAGDFPSLPHLLSAHFPGRFLPVPLMRQSRNYTCGAAAVQGMLAYFGEDFRETQLETILGSHPHHGTTIRDISEFLTAMEDPVQQQRLREVLGEDEISERPMAKAFMEYHHRITGSRELYVPTGPAAPDCPPHPEATLPVELRGAGGLSEVQAAIDRGHPVLVVLQAWAHAPSHYGTRWDAGHYAVVVGYDATHVYLMDPSTTGNYTRLAYADLLQRWYDYEGYLSDSTGERCPGGYSYRQFALELGAATPSPYHWTNIVPLE